MLNIYQANHPHSIEITNAFHEGMPENESRIVPPNGLFPGEAFVYGILRGCGNIINECNKHDRTYYHTDHGYFRPGHYNGYYRITKNSQQHTTLQDMPADRFNKLNIKFAPWRKTGNHVLVTPMSQFVASFLGIDHRQWLNDTLNELKQYTDRPIVVKPKNSEMKIQEALDQAWCLVTFNSLSAIDSIKMGIPAIVTGPSCLQTIQSREIREIENPKTGDREMWAKDMAYRQFTLDEMRNGTAWEIIQEYY